MKPHGRPADAASCLHDQVLPQHDHRVVRGSPHAPPGRHYSQLGFGEVMSGELSPELEAAARALKVGGVSDAVETAAGIHLLYRSA